MKKSFILVCALFVCGCSAPKNPVGSVKRAGRKSVSRLKNILPGFGQGHPAKASGKSSIKTISEEDYIAGGSFNRISNIIGPTLPHPGGSAGSSMPIFSTSDMLAAGNFQHLLMGKGTLNEREAALGKLVNAPQILPESRRVLEIIAKTPGDPLSHLGVKGVAFFNDEAAQRLVIGSLGDPRTHVRYEALHQTIQHRYRGLYDICLRRLRSDKNPAMRTLACLGLGVAGDKKAADFLRISTGRDMPSVRIAAAWSLFVLGDPYGRNFLEQVAVADELHLSPAAINVLADIPDLRAVNALVQTLGAKHTSVWKCAFSNLLQTRTDIPPGSFDIPYPEVNMGAAFNSRFSRIRRRAALVAIARRDPPGPDADKKRYALLNEVAAQGSPEEKTLMAAVLYESGTERGIEPLLRCLSDKDRKVVTSADRALRQVAGSGFSTPPQGSDSSRWRVWWINNCRTRRVRDSHSRRVVVVINTPDQTNYFAAKGAAIVPGVIINDSDEEGGSARVALEFEGKLYQLESE